MIGGVLLAGGQGRRMGGADKALLTLAGSPLLDHAARRLAPQVDRLALSANAAPARFAAFGLPVLPDGAFLGAGPLAGALAGLDWAAREGLAAIVTLPVDTPFAPSDFAARLAAAAGALGAPMAVAVDERGVHAAAAFWSVGLAEPLRAALAEGVRRVRAFAASVGAVEARFPGEGAFLNLNTPADLAAAEAALAAARARPA